MGDNSSTPEGDSSEAYDDDRSIDVEAEDSDWSDETYSTRGGILGIGTGELLKFLGYMVLLAAAGEVGKQAVQRLAE